MKPVRRAARALMSGLFVIQGAQALANPDPLAEPASRVTARLSRLHPAIPADPRTLVRINGAAQVIGGVLLNTAAHRPAAALLAGSMVPTTLAGHPFWSHDDPAQRKAQRIQFLKNLSLLGGLLLAAVDTEGAPGLPWRARHAARHAKQQASRAATEANKSVHRTAKGAKNRARLAVRAANVGRHLPG
jgi:putative oxidoreductase